MDILTRIVQKRRETIHRLKKERPAENLRRIVPPPLPLFKTNGEVTVIAECKKASPSAGLLVPEYQPERIADEYARGGADALSVLTEPDFFLGADEHLISVKDSVGLPVLRKDFIFDEYQVRQSWAIGADAILLIAAILNTEVLNTLCRSAQDLGLQVLLEVHNAEELQRIINVPADAIGINARNLRDFSVNLQNVKKIFDKIPDNKIAVAESGIKSGSSGKQLYDSGFRAFLVGEYFVTARNRIQTVRSFKEALCA